MGDLAEEPGQETLLLLRGLGGDGTPFLRRRGSAFHLGVDRLVSCTAVRQGKMLLQRTDEDVSFTQTFTQAADEFHLLRDEFALLDDLLILDLQLTLEHR